MSDPNLTNTLSQYLDELGNTWMTRRKKELEPRWNRNWMMLEGLDPFPEFKKDDGGGVKGQEWRSDDVLNITRPKVYSVFAMLLEILLPDGNIPFILDIDDTLEGEEKESEEAARDKMKKKIRQQLRQRHADREAMKKLLSRLFYGLSWSKYTVKPVKQKGFEKIAKKVPDNVFFLDEKHQETRYRPFKKSEPVPGHEHRSVWSIYWDMEVSFDKLEEGQGVFERDLISLYDLRQKIGKKGYIENAIEKVIQEAQQDDKTPKEGDSLPPGLRYVSERKRNIDNREMWMRIPRKLADQFEKEELGDIIRGEDSTVNMFYAEEEDGDDVFILAELADGEIIKYQRRATSDLAYKMCVWEENIDQPNNPGRCPPDNLANVQAIYTGLWRGFLDNKKLSGNVMTAIKRKFLMDASQYDEGFKPGTTVDISNDCPDVRQAIQALVIPDVGETYLSAIGLTDRMKDFVSMLPEILQGFVLPKHKPDTAYEVNQLQQNAGKYVGLGIRNNDEQDIEPWIWDIYSYNMADPNVDPEAKGNFLCIPGGFTNFKNKVLTVQQLERLLALLLSSELLAPEAKLRTVLEEIFKNMGFDAGKYLKSDEEKQEEFEKTIQMEQAQRQQALQDLKAQKDIETEGKIAEIEAKADAEAEKDEDNAQRDRGKDEDDFQRDIVTEVVKKLAAGGEA